VAQYRCCDNSCFGLGLVCQDCIVDHHEHLPLHWIEVWNNNYYESVTLRELGLSVTVGHAHGGGCPHQYTTTKEFTVLHTNGIHGVDVGFCGCYGADPEPRNLLLQAVWYPSTPLSPEMGITFELLRQSHALNCNAKLPAWDLW
ncbi:hypothetical protein BDZ89DRAFT_905700, partial [Hymenopellis radicata]